MDRVMYRKIAVMMGRLEGASTMPENAGKDAAALLGEMLDMMDSGELIIYRYKKEKEEENQ